MKPKKPNASGMSKAQAARLAALLAAIPQPLDDGRRGGGVIEGPPGLLRALDFFDEVWREIWRKWQNGAGPEPPDISAYRTASSWLQRATLDGIMPSCGSWLRRQRNDE